VKHFYTVPTVLLDSSPPRAAHDALQLPDEPAYCLVVVHGWPDHQAQDEWEARPEVTPHYLEDQTVAAAAPLVAGLRRYGIVSGDSFRQVLRKLRSEWPAARP
jgi:hypothetical protein